MYLLMIYCERRQREALLDEFADWQGVGATVLLSGISNKVHEGFIFMGWDTPIPESFRQKLQDDPDILDYIAFATPTLPMETPEKPA